MNSLWTAEYFVTLANGCATGERAAQHGSYQPLGDKVAHELAQARAHIERAAKLCGVDTSAFPRVAGGRDLREVTP